MENNNSILRNSIAKNGFPLYQCAAMLGYSEKTFRKILSKELPKDFQDKFADYLTKKRNGEVCDTSFIDNFKERRNLEKYINKVEIIAGRKTSNASALRKTCNILYDMEEKRIAETGCI